MSVILAAQTDRLHVILRPSVEEAILYEMRDARCDSSLS